MLSATCPHCQATLKLLDRHLGRVVRCPKCRGKFRVSDPESHDADSSLPHTATFYEAEETGVSPRTVVFVASALFFVIAIGVLVAAGIQSNAKQQQQSAVALSRSAPQNLPGRPAPARETRSHWRDDDFEPIRAVSIFAVVWVYLLIVIVWLVVDVALMVWVVKDSRNRGDDNGVLWVFVILLAGLIGLIVYLAARRSGTLVTCENCQNRKLLYAVACPHCGVKAATSAP